MATTVAIAVMAQTRFANAWGPEGHMIVAEIAQRNLTPATKKALKMLLPTDTTLSDVANWADSVRGSRPSTAPWHFVDIPRSADSYEPSRDCKNDDCVVAQIERLARVLKDKKALKKERAEALKFLVHFVGDMHQPLHAADENDRGGNEKKVHLDLDRFTVKSAKNLHGVWDRAIIEAREVGQAAYVRELAALTDEEKAELRRGTVSEWANQSHEQGKAIAYGALPPAGTNKVYTLNDDYFEKGISSVDIELQRAGLRLARLLNEALGGARPPQ